MEVVETKLPGLMVLKPKRFDDCRGFFGEAYNQRVYGGFGVCDTFVQDNYSLSVTVGTIRGLHFQAPPYAQAKLVRCGRGAIFDVAVDIRRGSPTYGRWAGYTLSEENGSQLYIPKGFAHGFMTLEPDSQIIYKCSNYYAPESEGVLRWDDPDIGIAWPLTSAPVLSGKDAAAPLLAVFNSPFTWGDSR